MLQEFTDDVNVIMHDPALPKTLEHLRDADQLDDAVGMKLLEMTQSKPDKPMAAKSSLAVDSERISGCNVQGFGRCRDESSYTCRFM